MWLWMVRWNIVICVVIIFKAWVVIIIKNWFWLIFWFWIRNECFYYENGKTDEDDAKNGNTDHCFNAVLLTFEYLFIKEQKQKAHPIKSKKIEVYIMVDLCSLSSFFDFDFWLSFIRITFGCYVREIDMRRMMTFIAFHLKTTRWSWGRCNRLVVNIDGPDENGTYDKKNKADDEDRDWMRELFCLDMYAWIRLVYDNFEGFADFGGVIDRTAHWVRLIHIVILVVDQTCCGCGCGRPAFAVVFLGSAVTGLRHHG